jgi:hypothetical protein
MIASRPLALEEGWHEAVQIANCPFSIACIRAGRSSLGFIFFIGNVNALIHSPSPQGRRGSRLITTDAAIKCRAFGANKKLGFLRVMSMMLMKLRPKINK